MKTLLALSLVSCGFAVAQETHSATLTWTPNASNPTGTTTNIWRLTGTCPSPGPSTTPPSGFTQLNTSAVTGTTFTDTTVAAATTYCYVATAVNSNGQSVPSGTAQATIPGAYWVTGLTAVSSGANIVLSWTDSTNPSGTTYFAWRLSGSCPATAPTSTPPLGFTQLTTTAISGLTYTDSSVSPGDSYCYVITAQGSTGLPSIPSNTSGATVPAAFPVSGLGISVK